MNNYLPLSTESQNEAPAIQSVPLHDRTLLQSESGSLNHHHNPSSISPRDARLVEHRRPEPFAQSFHEKSAAWRMEYKPFALRWPFLGVLLVSLLALMGLLAYGLHVLPQERLGDGVLRNAEDVARTRGLLQDAKRRLTERELWTTTDDYLSTSSTETETETQSSGGFGIITATVTETITATSSLQGLITISVTATMKYEPDTSLSSSDTFIVTETIATETATMESSDGKTTDPGATAPNAPDVAESSMARTDTSSPDSSATVPDAFGVVGTSITNTLTLISPLITTTVSSHFDTFKTGGPGAKVSGSTTTDSNLFKVTNEFDVRTTTIFKNGTPVSTFRTTMGSGRDAGVSTTSDAPTSSSTSSDAFGKIGHSETVLVKTFITASVTTMTNAAGLPTSTSTVIPSAVSTPTTATLTDSLGHPTATIVTSELSPPITTVLTNGDGIATRTVVVYPIPTTPPAEPQVFYMSAPQYFIGFCLPTLLSILVAIPIRALNMNAKLFQPWHELTQASGATGQESLNLPTSGFISYTNGLRALLGGSMVISLTTILMMCSVLLVPLSAETIVLQLRGNCVDGSAGGCTYQLGVSEIPAKAAIALLAFMCVLVILIFVFLWRWKSGVYTNPWSICGMAGLTQNRDVRALFVQGMKSRAPQGSGPEGTLNSKIADRRFKLDWFHNGGGKMEYGVMLWDRHSEVAPLHRDPHAAQEEESSDSQAKDANRLPFMLGLFGSLLFLSVLLGLLALIAYYNSTGDDTAFERFMDSQSFGTKFLFTSIGTIVTLFWTSFVGSVAIISPYQLLSQNPQVAKHSILLSPPTNALSSILSGIRRRHLLLVVVGITALLSEFLTIFLSNVPYRATQTFLASRICAYGAISILSIMTLVVIASLFVKWPYMPADPSTIAGAMYYLCDSWMLRDFEHFSVMGKSECSKRANAIGQSYKFGEFVGQTGVARVGVDAVSDEECV